MKRSELENRGKSFADTASQTVKNAPWRAVISSFVLGVLFTIFPQLVLSLIVVGAVVVGLVWYVSEPEEQVSTEASPTTETTAKPVTETTNETSKEAKEKATKAKHSMNGSSKKASDKKKESEASV